MGFSRKVITRAAKTRRSSKSVVGRSRKTKTLAIESLESRELLTGDLVQALDSVAGFYLPPHTFQVAKTLLGPTISSAPERATLSPVDVAMDYLKSNAADFGLHVTDLDQYRIADQYVSQHNGVTHIYLRQRHNGLDVLNADININVTADGQVLTAGSSFLKGLNYSYAPLPEGSGDVIAQIPLIGPGAALQALASQFGWTMEQASASFLPAMSADDQAHSTSAAMTDFGTSVTSYPGGGGLATVLPPSGISLESIPAQLRYVPLASGGIELAWGMVVQTVDGRHWYDASVSANDGELLYATDWVSHATYNVFPSPLESPDDGARALVTDAADPTASPFGWHDTDSRAGVGEFTDTRGNNVFAQEDREDIDDGFRPSGGQALAFDFPIDLTQRPVDNEGGAITNLFYQLNVVHDIHFLYGFDEAAGNFQETNLSGQGRGGDAIRADAQDGFEFGNAAFYGAPDGTPPRIQMGEWAANNILLVSSPFNLAGDYFAGAAAFGPALTTEGIAGDVVISEPIDGCAEFGNASEISGNIALVARGDCLFIEKVQFAQDAGAIGVIVTNNDPDGVVTMAGTAPEIEIPSLMISLVDGNALRAADNLGQTIRVRLTGTPNRDSSFDNGVIIHEYGHGVSTRLVGGPANSFALDGIQGAGMGEGWSDFWALMLTQQAGETATTPRPVGTYLLGHPTDGDGIRRFPYSFDMRVNPLTLDDVDDFKTDVICPSGCNESHNVGEVWAAALWDMNWLLIAGNGAGIPAQGFDSDFYRGTGGNNVALQLVMDGLKLVPSNPTILEGRNAILAADLALTGGENQFAIWTAFARRGIGFSAAISQSFGSLNVTEAFDIPSFSDEAEWFGDNGFGDVGDGFSWGDANNWTVNGVDDVAPSGVAPGDNVTLKSAPTVAAIDLQGQVRLVNSIFFEGDYSITGGTLVVSSGEVGVDGNVVAGIDADLTSGNTITKTGFGTLVLKGNAPDVVVDAGTLIVARSSTIDNLTIRDGGTVIMNGTRTGVLVNDGEFISAGDFSGDGSLTAADVDLMYAQLANAPSSFDPRFDLVADGVIDHLDLDDLIFNRIGTRYGDANANGVVDAVDFNVWSANRFTKDTTWSTGDYNRDGVSDVSDFNVWNANRFSPLAVGAASETKPQLRPPRQAASAGRRRN